MNNLFTHLENRRKAAQMVVHQRKLRAAKDKAFSPLVLLAAYLALKNQRRPRCGTMAHYSVED